MVSIGISEFTFGFAFLYEQTQRNWRNLTAAPILPSLRQEAEAAWDARLPLVGTDFFYQFKLSDLLSHGNAQYIKDGTYSAPYYRIALHRRDNNRQHRRLKQHAAMNPHTYYVAPEVSDIQDFNSAFLANQIVSRSRLIPVIDCQDFNDGEQHFITFEEGDPQWIDHSENLLHEKSFFGKEIESLYRNTSGNWTKIDRYFAADLLKKLESSIHDLSGKEGRIAKSLREGADGALAHQDKGDILKKAAQLAAVFYGLTLVIVGRPRS